MGEEVSEVPKELVGKNRRGSFAAMCPRWNNQCVHALRSETFLN